MMRFPWWCLAGSLFLMCPGRAWGTETPLLLVRIEIPALMTSVQRLSDLMEKASPGSSALLNVGIAAVTFNPKFGDFDLTRPITLFLYAYPEKSGGEMEWCFSLGKKGKDAARAASEEVPLYIKDSGDRCFVSRMPGLADIAAMVDLPRLQPESDGDFAITLWPATGLQRHRRLVRLLQGEGAKWLFQEAAGASHEAMTAARIYHLRFDLLEQFLRQSRETTVSIKLSPDRVDVAGILLPVPGSELARFCHAQPESDQEVATAALPADAAWGGAAHLTPTPALRQAMVGFFRSLAMELADHANPEYFAVMTGIWNAWSGRGSFFTVPGNDGKSSFSLHRLAMPENRPCRLLANTGSVMDDGERFYLLDQYPAHADLQFGLYEADDEVILVQYAGNEKDARAARNAVVGKPMVEIPLGRGEVLFRRHHDPTVETKDKTLPGKTCLVEYRFKFHDSYVAYQCSIPSELFNRSGLKNLLFKKP